MMKRTTSCWMRRPCRDTARLFVRQEDDRFLENETIRVTSLATLSFRKGFPTPETTERLFDDAHDISRDGGDPAEYLCALRSMPCARAMPTSARENPTRFLWFKDLMDAKSEFLTATTPPSMR